MQTMPEPFLSSEERQRYTDYYLDLLQKRLTWAANYAWENSRQPIALMEHMISWLQILRQSHLYPELHLSAISFIAALRQWPLHWGYWVEWEQELRFAVEVAATLQQPERQAEFLADLANILFNTGRLDEVLMVGEQVLSLARLGHVLLPLAEAGSMIASILFGRGQGEAAHHCLETLEREVTQDEIFGPRRETQFIAQA